MEMPIPGRAVPQTRRPNPALTRSRIRQGGPVGLLLVLIAVAGAIVATPPGASGAPGGASAGPPGPGRPPIAAAGTAPPARGRALLPGSRPFGPGVPPFGPAAPGAPRARLQVNGARRAPARPAARPADILYDQYDQQGGTATSSQAFEPAWAAYTDQGADDVPVPAGLNWTVDEVDAAGVYRGDGVASSVNVFFYADAAGLPGTPVFSQTVGAYTPGPNPGDFVIPLNPPAHLAAGTYWLSVQANEQYNPDGQWFWADRAQQANQIGAWRNPGNGFNLGCPAWAPRYNCFLWPPPYPDQVFRLLGSSNATPTPTGTGTPPTPTLTPTVNPASATPTRTPAPTLTGILPTPVGTQPAPVPPSETATPIPTCGPLWRPVASPNPGGPGNAFNAVAVIAATDIWAVGGTGGDGQTLAAHWDGTIWTVVPSPNPGMGYNYFSGVTAIATDDVWAVGTTSDDGFTSHALTEHWDGSTWSVVPGPDPGTTDSYLYRVAARGADDVWAVGISDQGGGFGQTLTAHWDGGAWAVVPSPNPGVNSNVLYDVTALGPADVWAVGNYDDNGSGTQTLVEHWDGATWVVVPSPSPGVYGNLLEAVAAVAANDIWATGYADDNGVSTQTLVEHWNGSAWVVVPSPSPGAFNNVLAALAAIGPGDVWAAGTSSPDFGGNNRTLTEHWDGSTWAVVPSPNLSANNDFLSGVAAVGPGDVWTVGGSNDGTGFRTLTMHFSDPCVTPSPTRSPTPSVTGTPPTATVTRTRTPTRTPTPTPCGGSGNYSYTTATGTLVPGTQDIGNHCDECSTLISLPFAYQLYNQTFTTVHAGANGELAFGIDAPSFTQITCLPNGTATYTIAPLWVDQNTASGVCTDCGIFTSTTGTAPNRIFNIEWRNLYYNESGPPTLDYEVRLYEGQLRFDLVYGLVANHSGGTDSPLVVGVQRSTSLYTQVGCDPSGTTPPVATGEVLIFTLPPCATATPSPAPTNTPSNTPTRTPTRLPTATATAAPSNTQTPPAPTVTPVAPTVTPVAPTGTPVPPTATPCAVSFGDVHPADYFFGPVTYLACHRVISGYGDGTFRPYANTTRSQMVKIVVLGFGKVITTPVGGGYTFADVPPAQPFYAVIETAARLTIVSGYTCGGPGEPCDGQNRPYFRPYANVTRGQLAKIAVVAAGWALRNPAGGTFADVAPNSAFYPFVETAACHGIISGYTCGGPGEPCDGQNRPYFRQFANATRGQIAKIVYLAVTGPPACGP